MIAEPYTSTSSNTTPRSPYRWRPGTRGLATAVGLMLGVLATVLLRPASVMMQSGLVLLVLAVVYVGAPLATAVRKTGRPAPDWGLALIGQGLGIAAIALLFLSVLISF